MQDQQASDDGTTCNEEEKDFQSASETSFHERVRSMIIVTYICIHVHIDLTV
jgi:hypothetical protein